MEILRTFCVKKLENTKRDSEEIIGGRRDFSRQL
jgi:hypothetical protein